MIIHAADHCAKFSGFPIQNDDSKIRNVFPGKIKYGILRKGIYLACHRRIDSGLESGKSGVGSLGIDLIFFKIWLADFPLFHSLGNEICDIREFVVMLIIKIKFLGKNLLLVGA